MQRAIKRLIDILLSGIALAMLVVPFAFIAAAIKLDSSGPVFFRQERVGKRGRSFIPLKFRTMQHGPAGG